MFIHKINTQSNKNTPAFTRHYSKKASMLFQKLDKDFVKNAKNKGCTQGLIVAIIKRMLMSPSYEKLNITQLTEELEKKLKEIIPNLKTDKGLQKIQIHYELTNQVTEAIKNQIEMLKKRNLAIKLYQAGTPLKDISQTVGLAIETIRRILLEKKVNLTQKHIDRRNKVVRLAKKGLLDAEIAALTGFSKNHIYNIRKEHNLPANLRDTNQRDLELVGKLLEGAPREEVAKEYGLKYRSLEHILGKYNVYKCLKKIRDDKIIRLTELGTPRNAIQEELNVSNETIKRVLRKAGKLD